MVRRGDRSVAPRRVAASARPTSEKIDGDRLHRAGEATSAWSREGVARAAATHSHATPSVWAIGLMYGRAQCPPKARDGDGDDDGNVDGDGDAPTSFNKFQLLLLLLLLLLLPH